MQLAGDGCFGVWVDGKLVSTTVALVYEPKLAWIGMVLTTEAERGKGHARKLLLEALEYCDRRGVACVKLDATDLGRPVYAKLGFVDERPVSRWRRPGGKKAQLMLEGGEIDLALDREAFGADRSGLLVALGKEETYRVPGRGFAYGRAGRRAWHFGPCVARDAEAGRMLLEAFLTAHGDEASFLDLCDEHEDAVRVAREAGYEPVRRLMRMYRGDAGCARVGSGPLVYCLGAFEYG